MAEFREVVKQKKRMHEHFIEHMCNNCPMNSNNNGHNLGCVTFVEKHPQEAEELIMKWAEEHPIKTNADKFKEVFGYELDFISIDGCVNKCILECREFSECTKCSKYDFWSQEYVEPDKE